MAARATPSRKREIASSRRAALAARSRCAASRRRYSSRGTVSRSLMWRGDCTHREGKPHGGRATRPAGQCRVFSSGDSRPRVSRRTLARAVDARLRCCGMRARRCSAVPWAGRRDDHDAERARVRLSEALRMRTDDVVALVGGGGKTTAMFRLAREIVEAGGQAITTTTTRIFAAQIALAPAHIAAAAATREGVGAALSVHGHVLVIGPSDPGTGKADGVSLNLFRSLRAWCPGAAILNEADGSRMRPFKAPAEHEPVIPAETTLVVPVGGAQVFGRPLDAEHVHRAELASALSGAPLGTSITPAIVARGLAHPEGGRKGVPAGARTVVLINKVEALADLALARETAERLLAEPAIHAVLLATVRGDKPVLDVFAR